MSPQGEEWEEWEVYLPQRCLPVPHPRKGADTCSGPILPAQGRTLGCSVNVVYMINREE